MVLLELRLLGQSHRAQRAGDGASSWGEDGTDEQHLSVLKDAPGKQRCKSPESLYNLGGQGEHGSSSLAGR